MDLLRIEQNKKAYRFIKRCLDIVISFCTIVLLIPIFLILIFLIKVDSKGPAIIVHKRVGKNNTQLNIYKFRSMVVDAYDLDKYFTEEQKKEYFKNFKLENDPRITRIGKFLRKTSLDELPQLFNILKGEMSIVGPRPVVEDELVFFADKVNEFLSLTPGLTGYWQANGRSNTTYEERVQMEIYYVRNCSFLLDVKIILKTIFAVFKGHGAM